MTTSKVVKDLQNEINRLQDFQNEICDFIPEHRDGETSQEAIILEWIQDLIKNRTDWQNLALSLRIFAVKAKMDGTDFGGLINPDDLLAVVAETEIKMQCPDCGLVLTSDC